MAYSNYYNMVKAVLLEKGVAFDEVDVRPSQESDYLAKSPMGKVPCLQTEQGFLTETSVIIDYLETLAQGPSFYPGDAFAKAKVQELMRYLELYLELPARRLYGEVFFGKPTTDEVKAAVRAELERGLAALHRIAKFAPYLAGSDISYADFYYRYSMGLVTIVCKQALGWDLYKDEPKIRTLLELMDQRQSVQKIAADQKAAA